MWKMVVEVLESEIWEFQCLGDLLVEIIESWRFLELRVEVFGRWEFGFDGCEEIEIGVNEFELVRMRTFGSSY